MGCKLVEFSSDQIGHELEKLMAIATDNQLSSDIRTQAIRSVGSIGNHEALLCLLELAANTHVMNKERELALKQAQIIVKREK
jgi:hypothetical protein